MILTPKLNLNYLNQQLHYRYKGDTIFKVHNRNYTSLKSLVLFYGSKEGTILKYESKSWYSIFLYQRCYTWVDEVLYQNTIVSPHKTKVLYIRAYLLLFEYFLKKRG